MRSTGACVECGRTTPLEVSTATDGLCATCRSEGPPSGEVVARRRRLQLVTGIASIALPLSVLVVVLALASQPTPSGTDAAKAFRNYQASVTLHAVLLIGSLGACILGVALAAWSASLDHRSDALGVLSMRANGSLAILFLALVMLFFWYAM